MQFNCEKCGEPLVKHKRDKYTKEYICPVDKKWGEYLAERMKVIWEKLGLK